MCDAGLDQKLEKMKQILRPLKRVAVAFSAGVDSTLALKIAVDTLGPQNVVAVTADSESLARAEYDQAAQLAESMGAQHVIIKTEEMDNPHYRTNPTDRCYYCKSELFDKLNDFIAQHNLNAVITGVNADDYDDWRPGIKAGNERNVRSPCAEAGMTKQDIRNLSKQMNLPTFDKPAMPCLASRVQYGEEITPEKLKQIEQAEAFLRSLGFRECRVRHHNNLARIEVPASDIETICRPEMRTKIDNALRKIGYNYVAIDIHGFRSGSMNEVIAFGKKQNTPE
ncbi:MAG: ATP-dependent sacrificial sulfur transferase LarE [Planctomycetota bacterium]|jgi:uncharacterized protein